VLSIDEKGSAGAGPFFFEAGNSARLPPTAA